MFTLPDAIISLLTPFSTVFQRRTWLKPNCCRLATSRPLASEP